MTENRWKVEMRPAACIEPSPLNARTEFDEAYIAELAESIAMYGLRQPIEVRFRGYRNHPSGSGMVPVYEIVTGECRFRACLKVGMTSIPTVLVHATDPVARRLGLIENICRRDLNPLDLARGLQALIDEGLTQDEVARVVHKSRTWVSKTLGILDLPQDIQDRVAAGEVSASAARTMAPHADEPDVLAEMQAKGSVREMEDVPRGTSGVQQAHGGTDRREAESGADSHADETQPGLPVGSVWEWTAGPAGEMEAYEVVRADGPNTVGWRCIYSDVRRGIVGQIGSLERFWGSPAEYLRAKADQRIAERANAERGGDGPECDARGAAGSGAGSHNPAEAEAVLVRRKADREDVRRVLSNPGSSMVDLADEQNRITTLSRYDFERHWERVE